MRNKNLMKFLFPIAILFFVNVQAFSQTIDVKKFGAMADGKTDDTKAVQAAIDAAHTFLNPTVYFPAGTYLIGQYTVTDNYLENYCLKIKSRVKFKGAGKRSIIKLADRMFDKTDSTANAHIFFGTHIDDVEFCDLLIDLNGENNLVPKDVIKNNMALFIDHGSHIRISNMIIQNCSGQNMITVKGTGHNLKIEKSFFYNGGNYVGTPVANKYQVDFSFLYSTWDSTIISDNHIEQKDVDIALSNYTGGIELHGSYSVAKHNTVIGCNPAFYISSTWHPMEKTAVTDNKILQCLRGISFWVHYPLNNITISNNYIGLTYSRALKPSFICGIEVPNGNADVYNNPMANNAILNNILIKGNTIDAALSDTSNDKTAGLILHSLQNSSIENNDIIGMNYGGVVMQGSKCGMKSVTIKKNNFTDFETNNNNTLAVVGFVVITDTYSSSHTNAPGMKAIFFNQNKFTKKVAVPSLASRPGKGKFFGAFIALPGNMLTEIHFDKNVFASDNEEIVFVKTD